MLQALGSLFITSYNSQGYGRGIRARLRPEFLILAAWDSCYVALGRPPQKTPLPLLLRAVASAEMCLPSRCIEMNYSGLRRHVTMLIETFFICWKENAKWWEQVKLEFRTCNIASNSRRVNLSTFYNVNTVQITKQKSDVKAKMVHHLMEFVQFKLMNKLRKEELHNLYSLPSIIRMIKSSSMRWERHVARMRPKRNACRTLVGNQEGEKWLGRRRHIRMDLWEIGWGGMDWIDLAEVRNQWRAFLNTSLNLRFP
jgi:hypothetical protein